MLVGDLLDQAHRHHDGEPAADLRLITSLSHALTRLPLSADWSSKTQHAPVPRTRITAVVLARDEQETIGRCIQALAGDVDEVLVIDSGSTDETVKTAERQEIPVRVVHAPWREDFALQRNVAFDHITEGWILMVDADEVLTPETRGTIRKSLTLLDRLLPGADLAVCPQVCDLHDPGGLYTDLPRAIRAASRLRYRGRVHERPYDPDGNAPETVHISSRFTHYGYQPQVMAAKHKLDRHARLLDLCIRDEPENPKWTFYRVRAELQHTTSPAQSKELFGQLETALAHCPPDGPHYLTERSQDSWAVLCELALRFGDTERVTAYADLLDHAGRDAEATYYRAVVTMSQALHRLTQLSQQIRAKAAHPARCGVRDIGRLHEVDGFLSLATGRYELAHEALQSARRHGAGTDLAAELTALRDTATTWPHNPTATSRSTAPDMRS
ncbi:hypothetical protein CFP65_1999 [Kitasatospora sp. MMS16-BH015]|uniref:glycosyltransferase family 2 protein n=1 Tax=Kitasatospora sp. MMS16-BH015 TaxID=2018025 RepID=UPI000CA12478|nr:glycosyltransferase family 2 protein [Kitasatospora sp. MMS16-BH015]AUG76864.1 hypothetical protein CFP65_1999 [Kitasatospora sp. MMS16-BH015]